jgi:hypothetical protein
MTRTKQQARKSESTRVPMPLDGKPWRESRVNPRPTPTRIQPSRKTITRQQAVIDSMPFFNAGIVYSLLSNEPLWIICLDPTPGFVKVENLDGYFSSVSFESISTTPLNGWTTFESGQRLAKLNKWKEELSHRQQTTSTIDSDNPFGDEKKE